MSIELAATAAGFLAPYLEEAGKEAAKAVSTKTAGSSAIDQSAFRTVPSGLAPRKHSLAGVA
jgi:hypothetical protein